MQQINLYLPELREKKEWLTANTMVCSTIGFVLLMSVAVIALRYELEGIERSVITVESQKVAIQGRVDQIRTTPRHMDSKQLERRLLRLRRSLAQRKRLGETISGQSLGNEQGFSEQLLSIASQSIRSISLSQIKLSTGGQYLEVRGKTKKPSDVPLYIQKLQQEPSFNEVRFGLVSVQKTSSRRVHDFSLGFESVYDVAVKEASR